MLPPSRANIADWRGVLPLLSGSRDADAEPGPENWPSGGLRTYRYVSKQLVSLERSPERLLEFRATAAYASVRNRYPWIRGLPVEHVRPNPVIRCWIMRGCKEPVEIETTACAYGHFRLETALACCSFPEDSDCSYGDFLLGEERSDGSLRCRGMVANPAVEVIECVVLPLGFIRHRMFRRFGDLIIALGGNWELMFTSVYSVYAPKAALAERGTTLDQLLDDAMDECRRMLGD
jgi:hypothetical protein